MLGTGGSAVPGELAICLCAARIDSEAVRKAFDAVGYDWLISRIEASAARSVPMSLFSFASADPPGGLGCDPASAPSGEPLPGIRPDEESSPP